MHHRLPPSKTRWPSLNMVIFPPVLRLVLDDPKQWPPRGSLIKFTSYLGRPLHFGWINNWATGLLTWASWVHHSWRYGQAEALRQVGPEMPERGSKTSTVPVVWATFGIFFGAIQMISCRDWWPWTKSGYITVIRKQSNNQWAGAIEAHPAPRIPSAKIRWKISCFDFLGSRRHPPHWLSFKGPNYHRVVLLISAGANEGHLEGKMPREGHQRVLFLHDNAPAHRALASQKKLAYLDFQCLDHPPYSPDLAPSDYHLLPGLKKQLKGHHFSSEAEVIAAAEI